VRLRDRRAFVALAHGGAFQIRVRGSRVRASCLCWPRLCPHRQAVRRRPSRNRSSSRTRTRRSTHRRPLACDRCSKLCARSSSARQYREATGARACLLTAYLWISCAQVPHCPRRRPASAQICWEAHARHAAGGSQVPLSLFVSGLVPASASAWSVESGAASAPDWKKAASLAGGQTTTWRLVCQRIEQVDEAREQGPEERRRRYLQMWAKTSSSMR
jgi:hypothetical protein